ncbi:hypothetical protein J6590_056139 [Homalodisca vitripennis]|nr:hypothetical protein J6590_056139 [Homalodisca vitripennis]
MVDKLHEYQGCLGRLHTFRASCRARWQEPTILYTLMVDKLHEYQGCLGRLHSFRASCRARWQERKVVHTVGSTNVVSGWWTNFTSTRAVWAAFTHSGPRAERAGRNAKLYIL